MKRHPDLEREILLIVEADEHEGSQLLDLSNIEGYSTQQVGYHVLLLHEAGLIEAINVSSMGDRFDWIPERLTMRGHQYLETIRDPEIWRKTKEGAAKVGSYSIELLSALAKGFLRQQVKKLTGVEIEL